MVITIDGPSGAGKSTVSRLLARRLGFACLDTGALYRAVALAAKWDPPQSDHEEVVSAWLTRVDLTVDLAGMGFKVFLDGRDVEPFIRNEEIGGLASRMSAMKPVRAFLLKAQRKAADQGDLVAEGRDMGTVVFPDAELKVFLNASAEERARRRCLELNQNGGNLNVAQVRMEIEKRDARDKARAISPLKPAPGAVDVDTTGMTIEQVVEHIAGLAGRGEGGNLK